MGHGAWGRMGIMGRPDFAPNGLLSVGFQTRVFKPTGKHEGDMAVRKRASKRQPGTAPGCCGGGGVLAIYVQYNEVCAYKQPVSSYGLACACFCEGFVSY
jgi:hypothetical protein